MNKGKYYHDPVLLEFDNKEVNRDNFFLNYSSQYVIKL